MRSDLGLLLSTPPYSFGKSIAGHSSRVMKPTQNVVKSAYAASWRLSANRPFSAQLVAHPSLYHLSNSYSTRHGSNRGNLDRASFASHVSQHGPLMATPEIPVHGFPQAIPGVVTNLQPEEQPRARTLVLCFDGTCEKFDEDHSNIIKFFQLLKKDDVLDQMVYYQPGLGTGLDTGSGPTNLGVAQIVREKADALFATELSTHVRSGYKFLMQNYREGDKISMFGFSRGAYIARALAGMIQKVGLLPAYNSEQIKNAYEMFTRDNHIGRKMSQDFKRACSIEVTVDFLGLFDTVSSVGLIPRHLPFSNSNDLVRVFRHALALDERRVRFQPVLWGRASKNEHECDRQGRQRIYSPSQHGGGQNHELVIPTRPDTDSKEVWFAGAHSDVGGGALANREKHNLSRIPLRWMVRECFKNNTGILFRSAELAELGMNPSLMFPEFRPLESPISLEKDKGCVSEPSDKDAHSKKYDNRTSNTIAQLACSEDETDAKHSIHDRLDYRNISNLLWWLLECFPESFTKGPHWGRSRVIRDVSSRPNVHRSVLYRKEQVLGYRPRVQLPEDPVWVD